MMRYRKYWYGGGVALLSGVVEYSIASASGPFASGMLHDGGGFMTTGIMHATYDFMYFDDLTNTTATLPTLSALVAQPHNGGNSTTAQSVGSSSVFQSGTTVYNEDWERYTVPGSLAIWCSVKLVLTALTITISAPTGCLGPTIAVGAGLGRLIGEAGLHQLALDLTGVGIPPSQLATAGAAAFAAGVTGSVSVAMIVFELTNNLTLGLPVLVSVLTARYVGSQLSESLYHHQSSPNCK